MYVDHPTFIPPQNADQKIWRYLDFTKFVDLLNSSALFFTRADYFDDVFEGSISKETLLKRSIRFEQMIKDGVLNDKYTPEFMNDLNQKTKKEIAINCWHMNDHESAAMWKLYLKSNEGVAVQSTFNRLIKSFEKTNISVNVGVVNYVDYETDFIPYGNAFAPYIHKRKNFEHEKELRCVVSGIGYQNKKLINLDKGGTHVDIQLSHLIENIFVSPDSPLWVIDLTRNITNKFGINCQIINSKLKDSPLF